jgi:hypothetical protein
MDAALGAGSWKDSSDAVSELWRLLDGTDFPTATDRLLPGDRIPEVIQKALRDLLREGLQLATQNLSQTQDDRTRETIVRVRQELQRLIAELDTLVDPASPPQFVVNTVGTTGSDAVRATATSEAKGEPTGAGQLPLSRLKAYQQYQEAIARSRETDGVLSKESEDRAVYDWLTEHGEERLPKFETWARYVRAARESSDTSKHSPRAGRTTGRSVVKRSEIDDAADNQR